MQRMVRGCSSRGCFRNVAAGRSGNGDRYDFGHEYWQSASQDDGAAKAAAVVNIPNEFKLSPSHFLIMTNLARSILGPLRDSFDDLRNMQVDIEVIGGSGKVIALLRSTENAIGVIVRGN